MNRLEVLELNLKSFYSTIIYMNLPNDLFIFVDLLAVRGE